MKTAVIKTFILLIVLLTAAAFPYRAYAEESVIIDGYSADIPPELEKEPLGRRDNAAKHRQRGSVCR